MVVLDSRAAGTAPPPLRRLYAEATNPAWSLCAAISYSSRMDRCVRTRTFMLDIILLALGVGAFGLFAAYAGGCERV
jgi:hypothetical protein